MVAPTLVAAGHVGRQRRLRGVRGPAHGGGGCEATLTLWVSLPDGLPDDVVAAAAAGSLAQISKELRLMKRALEDRADRDGRAEGGA